MDPGIVTEKEVQRLNEWKGYPVMLSRVELNVVEVIWPVQPAKVRPLIVC